MRRLAIATWFDPLGDYLARQAAGGQHQVVLCFAEIEATITAHPRPRGAPVAVLVAELVAE